MNSAYSTIAESPLCHKGNNLPEISQVTGWPHSSFVVPSLLALEVVAERLEESSIS